MEDHGKPQDPRLLFKQYHTTKFTSELEMMSMQFCWKLDSCRDKHCRTITVQDQFGRRCGDRLTMEFDSHNGLKMVFRMLKQKHTMPSKLSSTPMCLPQHNCRDTVLFVHFKSGLSLSLSICPLLPCLSRDQGLFLGFDCDCSLITALRQASRTDAESKASTRPAIHHGKIRKSHQ